MKANFPQPIVVLDSRPSPLVIIDLAENADPASHASSAVQDDGKHHPANMTVVSADQAWAFTPA